MSNGVAAVTLRQELEKLRSQSPARSPVLSLWLIFGLTLLGVLGVGGVLFLRLPPQESQLYITAIIGFVGPTIASVLALMLRDVHLDVNSRVSQLVDAVAIASESEGAGRGRLELAAERQELQDRQDAREKAIREEIRTARESQDKPPAAPVST